MLARDHIDPEGLGNRALSSSYPLKELFEQTARRLIRQVRLE